MLRVKIDGKRPSIAGLFPSACVFGTGAGGAGLAEVIVLMPPRQRHGERAVPVLSR